MTNVVNAPPPLVSRNHPNSTTHLYEGFCTEHRIQDGVNVGSDILNQQTPSFLHGQLNRGHK